MTIAYVVLNTLAFVKKLEVAGVEYKAAET